MINRFLLLDYSNSIKNEKIIFRRFQKLLLIKNDFEIIINWIIYAENISKLDLAK